jgi:hypothetical protein
MREVELRSFELRAAAWFARDALPPRRRDVVDRILALDTRFAAPPGG